MIIIDMKVDLDKWYRPQVDKEEFRKLCEKSDWAGFKHVLIYFSVLIFLDILLTFHGELGGVFYFYNLWKYICM